MYYILMETSIKECFSVCANIEALMVFLPCSIFSLVSLQRFSLTLSVRQQVTVDHVITVFLPCVCHCCSQLNFLVLKISFICIWKNIILKIWMNHDQDIFLTGFVGYIQPTSLCRLYNYWHQWSL